MTKKSDKRKLNIFQCQYLTGRLRIRWQQRMTNTTSFPGSTPLSRGLLRAEKTQVRTVRSPAKYSTNGGVFCHVTHNRMSSSLHLISGSWNQKWLKMREDLASMWLHFACSSCKIYFFSLLSIYPFKLFLGIFGDASFFPVNAEKIPESCLFGQFHFAVTG